MYYVVEVIRNEAREVIDHVILGANSQGSGPRGKELIFIKDNRDLDFSRIKVSFDEMGTPFLEDDPAKLAKIAAEADIEVRMKRIQFGQRLIAMMGIRNDAKNLTVEQLMTLVGSFAAINTAWLNGMISSSRSLIDAITPDGTLLTAEDKAAILSEIDANWSLLGYE